MNIFWLTEIDSTNNAIISNKATLPDKSVYATYFQSSGKGQRGNSWESERNKNLTFSILFKPENIKAEDQFKISQATTLGLVKYLAEKNINAKIKWPNDIYVGDMKICGILIENSISNAMLSHSVVGIGININQTKFISNAPNPISISMITKQDYIIEDELETLLSHIENEYDNINESTQIRYLENLYRKNEWHNYIDCATHETFSGKIIGIDDFARLKVETQSGDIKSFAFKEISYCI